MQTQSLGIVSRIKQQGGVVMRSLLIGLVLAVVSVSAQAVCTPEQLKAAVSTRILLAEMVDKVTGEDALTVHWGKDFDAVTPDQQFQLIRAFADTDACITGKPRQIDFYRSGKKVGEASPRTGVSLK